MIALTSHACTIAARHILPCMTIHLLGDTDGNAYGNRLFILGLIVALLARGGQHGLHLAGRRG